MVAQVLTTMGCNRSSWSDYCKLRVIWASLPQLFCVRLIQLVIEMPTRISLHAQKLKLRTKEEKHISYPACTAVSADAMWQLSGTEKRNTQCSLSAFWEIRARTSESPQGYISPLKALLVGSEAFDFLRDSGIHYFATFFWRQNRYIAYSSGIAEPTFLWVECKYFIKYKPLVWQLNSQTSV